MGIKTVPHPPYCPDFAPRDFWLFPKLRGCRYETNEEMKEAVTKVINTLAHEDFRGSFQKLLERYNKCIAAGEDYFKGDWSFMCAHTKKILCSKSWEQKEHNRKAVWINDMKLQGLEEGPEKDIHKELLKGALKKVSGWKTPGYDGRHGF